MIPTTRAALIFQKHTNTHHCVHGEKNLCVICAATTSSSFAVLMVVHKTKT
jgi:hypothetical protein